MTTYFSAYLRDFDPGDDADASYSDTATRTAMPTCPKGHQNIPSFTSDTWYQCAICGIYFWSIRHDDGYENRPYQDDDPSTLMVPPPERNDVLAEVAAQRKAQRAMDDDALPFERLDPRDADDA